MTPVRDVDRAIFFMANAAWLRASVTGTNTPIDVLLSICAFAIAMAAFYWAWKATQ